MQKFRLELKRVRLTESAVTVPNISTTPEQPWWLRIFLQKNNIDKKDFAEKQFIITPAKFLVSLLGA